MGLSSPKLTALLSLVVRNLLTILSLGLLLVGVLLFRSPSLSSAASGYQAPSAGLNTPAHPASAPGPGEFRRPTLPPLIPQPAVNARYNVGPARK